MVVSVQTTLSDANSGYLVLYTNIDQKVVNSLHGLLNCEIGGLDCLCLCFTTENSTRVHCIHMYHLFCNALVHVIKFRSFRSKFVYNKTTKTNKHTFERTVTLTRLNTCHCWHSYSTNFIIKVTSFLHLNY